MHARKHDMPVSTEERLAVLETTILNIGSVLINIERKIDALELRIEKRFEHLENRLENLENKFDQKFEYLENKFDKKFEHLENKFDRKIDNLHSRLWTNFIWTVGIAIGLAGLIAHAQHWI